VRPSATKQTNKPKNPINYDFPKMPISEFPEPVNKLIYMVKWTVQM
jgi:hypothetical protein